MFRFLSIPPNLNAAGVATSTDSFSGLLSSADDDIQAALDTLDDYTHDTLPEFVANEHINHTAVTLTAGEGLTGGGDISANRTFDLDFPGLTASSTIAASDLLAMYDATTDTQHEKITFATFESKLTHTNLLSLNTDDHTQYLLLAGRSGQNISDTINVGNISGGNYLTIESDGTLRFIGDATVWDDVRVPITSVKLAGVKDPDFAVFTDSVRTYSFGDEAVNEEEVFFTCQLPHGYKEGSDICPHCHWSPSTAAAGTVRWGLEYTWQNIDGTFGSSTTIYIDDATDSTALKHHTAEFSTITGTNKTISSMLICRLFRNSSHANDTYTGNAFLLEIDFHIEKDTVGSRQELTK